MKRKVMINFGERLKAIQRVEDSRNKSMLDFMKYDSLEEQKVFEIMDHIEVQNQAINRVREIMNGKNTFNNK